MKLVIPKNLSLRFKLNQKANMIDRIYLEILSDHKINIDNYHPKL